MIKSDLILLHLTAGQVLDFKGADGLLAYLPDGQEKSSGAEAMTATGPDYHLENVISLPVFSRKNRKSKPLYNWDLYKKRHLIKKMFAK